MNNSTLISRFIHSGERSGLGSEGAPLSAAAAAAAALGVMSFHYFTFAFISCCFSVMFWSSPDRMMSTWTSSAQASARLNFTTTSKTPATATTAAVVTFNATKSPAGKQNQPFYFIFDFIWYSAALPLQLSILNMQPVQLAEMGTLCALHAP